MPRKRKYPETVNIPIPYEITKVYETPLLKLIFPERTAEMSQRIIDYIKTWGSIGRDEWKEIATNEAEHKLFNRTLNRMVTLGMLKRAKGGEFILSEEFSTKLGVLIEKWEAMRKKG